MNEREMKRIKAQLQTTETIFVIFLILVIVVIGFVIYSKFHEGTIKEKQREQRAREVIELAHRMSSWPELECSASGAQQFVCLDRIKLNVLSDFINKSRHTDSQAFNYYYDLLGDSQIIVKEVYPSNTQTYKKDYWRLYNNLGSTSHQNIIWVPVNLYNPLSRTYAFGVMEITLYE